MSETLVYLGRKHIHFKTHDIKVKAGLVTVPGALRMFRLISIVAVCESKRDECSMWDPKVVLIADPKAEPKR